MKNKIRCIESQNYSSELNPIENCLGLSEKLSKINLKTSRNSKIKSYKSKEKSKDQIERILFIVWIKVF